MADFGFADTNTGDVLAGVTIATLPSAGTLTLHGVELTVGASVNEAFLYGNGFVFTPAANAHGTGYASFTFKVSDGTAESASAYTMTIDVRPDDTLDALALSAGMLAPTFAPATEAYTASVANNVTRITVTATASRDAATVAFLDSNDADAGTNGHQVDLAVGATR